MKSSKINLLVNELHPSSKTLVRCLSCLIIIGVASILFLKYNSPKLLVTNPNVGTLVTVKTATRDISIVVYSDHVYIEPFEQNNEPTSFQGMTISSSNYPELFKNGASEQNFISARTVSKSGAEYTQISNNQPDHGGYSPTYSLYLEVKTGLITRSLEE